MKYYELTESKKVTMEGIVKLIDHDNPFDYGDDKAAEAWEKEHGWYRIILPGFAPRYVINKTGDVMYRCGEGSKKPLSMPLIGPDGDVWYNLCEITTKNKKHIRSFIPLKKLLTYSTLSEHNGGPLNNNDIDNVCENVKKEIIDHIKGE